MFTYYSTATTVGGKAFRATPSVPSHAQEFYDALNTTPILLAAARAGKGRGARRGA